MNYDGTALGTSKFQMVGSASLEIIYSTKRYVLISGKHGNRIPRLPTMDSNPPSNSPDACPLPLHKCHRELRYRMLGYDDVYHDHNLTGLARNQ
jgi:hypothetical protein